MERSLKHELWLLQNKLPKAWEYIKEENGCCPPTVESLTDDEMDVVCFNGCSLCWEEYFKNDFAEIKGAFEE